MNENRNSAGAIAGLALIGLGVLFLMGQFINFDIGRYLWPFLVIGFGGIFFVGMLAGGRSSSGLAIPGSIFATIGLILLFQNTFGHWEGWAYSWGLIVASVGVGLVIRGYYAGVEDYRRRGWRLFRLGMLFFLLFGAFFELVIGFAGHRTAAEVLWPVALIGVGFYLFVSRLLRGRQSEALPIPPTGPTSPNQSN